MSAPKWMVYQAFHSKKKRYAGHLRLLMHSVDFHPRREVYFAKNHFRAMITGREILVFLHAGKTGGTYLASQIKGVPFVTLNYSLLREDLDDAHIPLGLIGTRYRPAKNHFLFSTVRHPLHFFPSYYHHALGFGSYRNEQHYDYAIAQKGFEYLMKSILDRDDVWPSRRFLFPLLFDQSGRMVVSWINRTETLDEDMEALAREKGFEYQRGRPKRVSPRKGLDHYYSDSLREVIEKHYIREINLFGYGHDAEPSSDSILYRRVDPTRVRYVYTSDELSVM